MTSKCHFCFESAGVFCKLIMIQHLLSNWVDNTVSEPLSVCFLGLRKLFWSFFGQKFVVYNIFTNICGFIYGFWQLIELLKHDFCFTSHAVFCFTWGTNQILLSVFLVYSLFTTPWKYFENFWFNQTINFKMCNGENQNRQNEIEHNLSLFWNVLIFKNPIFGLFKPLIFWRFF